MVPRDICVICVVVVVIIAFVLVAYQIRNNSDAANSISSLMFDLPVWVYWENDETMRATPTFIELCKETMERHIASRLHYLNEKTIHKYVTIDPRIQRVFDENEHVTITHRADYYRVCLLEKHGGMWLDADTIVLRNFDDIFWKLRDYEFIGFGCSSDIRKCFNGKGKPCNGMMAAQTHSRMMARYKQLIEEKLLALGSGKLGYFDLGKHILWRAMRETQPTYYHFHAKYDGTRDKQGRYITAEQHMRKVDINTIRDAPELLDVGSAFFAPLTGNRMLRDPRYAWTLTCSRNELLYSDAWIGSLYRRALDK